jgi:hypothetical protein
VIGLLLSLALAAPVCDLKPLEREEKRLERIILALPDRDPKLPPLYEKWDKAVAAVDACKADLALYPPTAATE